MFDYVVQVGELLEFLCVDLHNQFDNVINQCYFDLCIVVHNGARNIIAWFLWAHLNSLDWPIKSSGPNCVCVICNIYIREKGRVAILLCFVFLFGIEKKMYCTNKLFRAHSYFGCWKGRANWTRGFSPSRIERILKHQKSTGMAFYGINQGQFFLIPNFYCML